MVRYVKNTPTDEHMDVIIAAVLVASAADSASFTVRQAMNHHQAYKNEMLSERQKIEIIDEVTANMLVTARLRSSVVSTIDVGIIRAMHQEPGQEMTQRCTCAWSVLAKNLVMLTSLHQELQVQSHSDSPQLRGKLTSS